MSNEHPAARPAPAHQFHAISDQLFSRATFDTLSDGERAALIGAVILKRHRKLGTFEKLNHLQRTRRGGQKESSSKSPALLLFSMAIFYGSPREHSAGLVIDATREEIAAAVGMSFRSTYRAIRDLERIGAIRRKTLAGPRPDQFELVMPPELPDEPEKLRSTLPTGARASVQANPTLHTGARASVQACTLSTNNDRLNTLQDVNLARASVQACTLSESNTAPQPHSLAENADACGLARAAEKDNHLSYLDHHHDDDDVEAGENKAEEAGRENVRQILEAIEIEGLHIDPPGRRFLLKLPTTTPARIQAALSHTESEIRRRRAKNWNVSPVGLLVAFIRDGVPDKPKTKAQSKPDPERLKEQQEHEEAKRLRVEIAALGQEELQKRVKVLADRHRGEVFWGDYWDKRVDQPVDPERLVDGAVRSVHGCGQQEGSAA